MFKWFSPPTPHPVVSTVGPFSRWDRPLLWVTPTLLNMAAAQSKTPLPFPHVFVLVLENTSARSVLGNPNLPTLNALARQYGLAMNYTGVAHPSLLNYVALLFGSTLGSRNDDPSQRFSGDNLALQLERAGKTWKGYMQGLPGPGWEGPFAGTYVKKHNPLMLSAEIAGNPRRARNVVPLEHLDADLRAGTAPTFALIVPDLCHDLYGALTAGGGHGWSRRGTPSCANGRGRSWPRAPGRTMPLWSSPSTRVRVGTGPAAAEPWRPLWSRATAPGECSRVGPTTITACCEPWKMLGGCLRSVPLRARPR